MARVGPSRVGAGAVLFTLLGGTPISPAAAAFPGANGKIAFTTDPGGDNEVYVMNADGSGKTNLTNNPGTDLQPAWSPDGTRIAFTTGRDGEREVYVMNADGSGQINLTSHPDPDEQPAWSPDGTRIAFRADRDGNDEVYAMNADGSGPANLTNSPANDFDPDWQAVKLQKTVSLKAKPKKVEKGEKTTLRARVSPCEGHEGDVVEFYRRKKRIATKTSNDACVARFKVKVRKTTRFTAVSPEQDVDHVAGTSKPVKVKVTR
ncbi:MAG: TolB family protein [Actinomycetota bacterium]